MNKDDLIRMAREAHGAMLASGRGMYLWHGDAYAGDVQDFCERFAALVAAAERQAVLETIDALYNSQDPNPMYQEGYNHALDNMEEFVKARSKS